MMARSEFRCTRYIISVQPPKQKRCFLKLLHFHCQMVVSCRNNFPVIISDQFQVIIFQQLRNSSNDGIHITVTPQASNSQTADLFKQSRTPTTCARTSFPYMYVCFLKELDSCRSRCQKISCPSQQRIVSNELHCSITYIHFLTQVIIYTDR